MLPQASELFPALFQDPIKFPEALKLYPGTQNSFLGRAPRPGRIQFAQCLGRLPSLELFWEMFWDPSRLLGLHPRTRDIFQNRFQDLVEFNVPKALEFCHKHRNSFQEMFRDPSKFLRPWNTIPGPGTFSGKGSEAWWHSICPRLWNAALGIGTLSRKCSKTQASS